ncbi:hypothetical protein KCP75_06975 [Salmonella enterica subsp. enterica]|nr:hypothetical protein KCP75_06975 [Salmonella enterica subsp. enterica]
MIDGMASPAGAGTLQTTSRNIKPQRLWRCHLLPALPASGLQGNLFTIER